MAKVKAEYYGGEPEQRRCAMTGRLFDQEKGLQFTLDKEPVSPEIAHKTGYELGEITPPPSVRNVTDLIRWITSEVGIQRTDKNYYTLFGRFHDIYKDTKTFK